MVFSSISFLYLFLPFVLGFYYLLPSRFRNPWLLAASLLFYVWGSGLLVLLLVVSAVADFIAGRVTARGIRSSSHQLVRAGVIGSVVVNVTLLGYFKYANFMVEQLNSAAATLGIGEIAWTSIALPIGISFFTFQSMSYTIDIATRRAEPIGRFSDFLLYVALFPQLIAGPIVRFHEIARDLLARQHTMERFADGVVRFTHGLAKKVLIADGVAALADAAFAASPGDLSAGDAWVGLLAYTVQIYFDFSGYSDMAIGLGLMLGFTFPENFRRPYSSLSITDFWRRWHITLSSWFRDYLYIPLGGSRSGTGRTYLNLWIVFLLTGLWHGAAWTFIVWGAYHGLLLVLERVTNLRGVDHVKTSLIPLRRVLTLLLVMCGWVWFRAVDLGSAIGYFKALLDASTMRLDAIAEVVTNRSLVVLVIGSLTFLLPSNFVTGVWLCRLRSTRVELARWSVAVLGLTLSSVALATGTFSPFLYYQF